ncbi:MAG: PVC-type heme-binding CxxCH protein [Pirellulales bacterium]
MPTRAARRFPSCFWPIAALLATSWLAPRAFAQGYPPEEAARHMTVPEGLEAQLVAAEPLVRQPVAIEFDDAGRLWVIQYLQYPNPAGLKRTKVDRYSRTQYDRVPDPPPRGPRGADRITILEDTDGDGRADRCKDFVDGLNLATGLAFGHGGVFVVQAPYLLFYPDRDRNDVPDGDPEVLVSGFGIEDAHSVANSLTWGPDGWLYGCQGSTVTAHIGGLEFQQGVWRYHPITRRFELFCEGGGNSWGLDFDAQGNLFYSTNYGGYAMLHGVQGAYYWKQFGKHGALHNPYAFGYFEHVPHKNLRGGHVTVGGIVYQGDTLGDAFRGKYIGADLLGHAVYWHDLDPRGSTFSASHAGDLLLAGDTWFAPSDVTAGPDGAIYVCDWHDQRTAHPDPDAQWDSTNGRIYRIAKKRTGVISPSKVDVASRSTAELIELLGHKNDWYVRKARRVLADRRDPEAILPLRAIVMESQDEHLALEALWALYVSGGLSDPFADKLLSHGSADVRWWTVRLLGDEERVSPFLALRLSEIARFDERVAVRAQLASTAKRLPSEQALAIIEPLLAYREDAGDPLVPLLLWWAVERHAISARKGILSMFARPEAWEQPIARDVIMEWLVRRYAAENTEAGYLACAALLAAAPEPGRGRMLAALDQGLKDRSATLGPDAGSLFADLAPLSGNTQKQIERTRDIPPQLAAEIDRAWHDDTTDVTLVRLAARLGRAKAHDRAIAIASDGRMPEAQRIEAVEALGEVGGPPAIEPLVKLIDAGASQALRLAALDALARFDDERIAAILVEKLPAMEPELRARTCDVLLAREAWALELLELVDRGGFTSKDIAVDQLRIVALHKNPQLDALVKKHWGTIQSGTPEERLAEMRRINNDLRAGGGDPQAGKALFVKHCGTCHRLFGEGNEIGPELTRGNRQNTAELLATIVDPSAVVRREYQNFLVQTTDGRVLSGLLVEQGPGSVTLLGAKNERATVAREAIETISESAVSLMPENILTPLAPQELRDLFIYLQSDAK